MYVCMCVRVVCCVCTCGVSALHGSSMCIVEKGVCVCESASVCRGTQVRPCVHVFMWCEHELAGACEYMHVCALHGLPMCISRGGKRAYASAVRACVCCVRMPYTVRCSIVENRTYVCCGRMP